MIHGGFAELRDEWERSGRGRPEEMMRNAHVESTPATFGHTGVDFANLTRKALPPRKYPTIIELGCGPARVTRWLGAYQRVYAVDIAPVFAEFIGRLQAEGELSNVVALTGNGTDLPIDAPVDGAYSSLVLMHNRREDVRAIFTALHELLRPGGRVAFQLPVYEVPFVGANWRQVSQWTEAEVIALAEATGYTPTKVWTNPGFYRARDPLHPPGPNHWALHLFDRP